MPLRLSPILPPVGNKLAAPRTAPQRWEAIHALRPVQLSPLVAREPGATEFLLASDALASMPCVISTVGPSARWLGVLGRHIRTVPGPGPGHGPGRPSEFWRRDRTGSKVVPESAALGIRLTRSRTASVTEVVPPKSCISLKLRPEAQAVGLHSPRRRIHYATTGSRPPKIFQT